MTNPTDAPNLPRPSYDEYPAARHEALRRVHAAMRRLNSATIRFDLEEDALRAFADDLEARADEAEALATIKPFLPFRVGIDPEDANSAIPFSPVTGLYNPLSPPLNLRVEGKLLIGEASFDERFEGPNQSVHGSIVAAVYDQMLASANILSDAAGPTGHLQIRYLRPTPLFETLRFEAWTESSEGRKTITKGRCLLGDQVLTESEGLFIRLDPNRVYPQWSNRPAGREAK